jgi:hypothetical protein
MLLEDGLSQRCEVDPKLLLELQLRWIERSDLKVNFLVPIILAMSGALLALIGETKVSEVQFSVSIFLFFLFSGTALVAALHSIFPRLNGPASSLIFFGGIAKLSSEEYREKATTASDADWERDLFSQIHINARLAQKKFSEVKFAIHMFSISIPFWGLSVYGVS